MEKKPGRPKIIKPIEEPTLTSFRKDIQIFKNSLADCLSEPEYQSRKETIQKFLALPVYQQNIFIVYLISNVSITQLANMLECDRTDVLRIIRKTKKELQDDLRNNL